MRRLARPNKSYLEILFWAAYTALFAVVMKPYFNCGYYGDDAQNATLSSYYQLQGFGFWGGCLKRIKESLAMGRLYPLSALNDLAVNTVFNTHASYRLFQLTMVFGNLILFYVIIAQLGGRPGKRIGQLSLLLLLGLFQMRFYSDPIASFGVLLQLITFFMFGAFYALQRYIFDEKKAALGCFVILLSAGLLTYEIALAVIPFFIGYIFFFTRTSVQPARRALIATVLVTIIYLSLAAYIRLHTPSLYEGIQFNWGSEAFMAFLYQISGAFPLVYLLSSSATFLDGPVFEFVVQNFDLFWTALLVLLILLVAWIIFKAPFDEKLSPYRNRRLIFIGLALLVSPSLLLSFSAKYQNQLSWGKAYLPVYLSYFGIAVLMAIGLARLKRSGIIICVSLILAAQIVVTNQTNLAVQHYSDLSYYIPRRIVEIAMEKGAFDNVPDGATLVYPTYNHWFIESFFYANLKKRYSVLDLKSLPREAATKSENYYIVQVQLRSESSGVLSIAQVRDVRDLSLRWKKDYETKLDN